MFIEYVFVCERLNYIHCKMHFFLNIQRRYAAFRQQLGKIFRQIIFQLQKSTVYGGVRCRQCMKSVV